jgi:hypothetical protein
MSISYQEICEKLRTGEMELDTSGHDIITNKDSFLQRYDEIVAYSQGSNDGEWGKSDPSGHKSSITDEQMRDHFKEILDKTYNQEDKLGGFEFESETCGLCGEKLRWVLTGDKLQLRNHVVSNPKARFGIEFVNYPAEYRCSFEHPQPTTGRILVKSPLIITNYFNGFDDTPQGKEHDQEYSLCSLAGRKKITEHKVQSNVAYGQMGNTTVGVYINEKHDTIILGPAYHPAESQNLTEKQYKAAIKKPVFEGFKKLKKTISLSVWRWEASDVKTIGKEGLNKLKELGKDFVRLDVPHGVWEFKHYYDSYRYEGLKEPLKHPENENIWAKLFLKEEQ